MPDHRFHKTRIAPTASGYLHLGNAFSFLLTKKIAREAGAKILLRIDDSDVQRIRREYVEDIFLTLSFLGIVCDEGPGNYAEYVNRFSQSHRQPLYTEALNILAEKKLVFACTCSRTQLENEPCSCDDKNIFLDQAGAAWRIKTDDARQITVRTLNDGTINASLPGEMKNFIVRKKDGSPSYQLSSLVDDLYYGIDLIVRGEDLWPSTLAQLYLAEKSGSLSFLNTVFHHHALLVGADQEKLSKSAGALSIKALRNAGTTREVIYEMTGLAKL